MDPYPTPCLDAVVIGAGISGLVSAWRLRRAGLSVVVLDAGARPGGVITSAEQDGFLYETGPNSALDTTPLIGAMVQDLGLAPSLRWASAAANRRYVLRRGVPVALPGTPLAFLATPLFSPAAKLALLREPFVRRGDAGREESIADFVRRRLGQEFLDYAIDPFVAGVYAGDPEQISVSAAFPKLAALEQRWGSLIRGQLLGARERARQGAAAKNAARSFSFDRGLQVLTDALAGASGDIRQKTRVCGLGLGADGSWLIQADGGGAGTTWRSRAVVLATPADAAAALLRPLAPDAADALQSIPYAPVASVAMGYARSAIAHPLDGFGCLVPRKEQRRLLGVLFSSSMFDGRAGARQVLLTSFVGGMRQPALVSLDEDELAALVAGEHQALLGASRAPLFQRVTRWPRAIPQYTLGHTGRVERALAAQQALPGLFFCANWLGGVAVGDCIKSGHATADAVAGHLHTKGLHGDCPEAGPDFALHQERR